MRVSWGVLVKPFIVNEWTVAHKTWALCAVPWTDAVGSLTTHGTDSQLEGAELGPCQELAAGDP